MALILLFLLMASQQALQIIKEGLAPAVPASESTSRPLSSVSSALRPLGEL